MLENAIKHYQSNLLSSSEIIEELIVLAKDIQKADRRGEELGLSYAELAFYDALADNRSVVEVLGDETHRDLARVLVDRARRNTSIDWTIKESVRARVEKTEAVTTLCRNIVTNVKPIALRHLDGQLNSAWNGH